MAYMLQMTSLDVFFFKEKVRMDGLVQERRNSIANTLELRLCCTNPLNYFDFASTEVHL